MLPGRINIFFKSIGGRLLLHLFYWMGVASLLTQFFGHFNQDYQYTFLFVCLLMPVAIGTTYFLNYVLIPRYLLQKRYRRFFTYFLFTLVFSVWGEMLAIIGALIMLADYRYSNMNPLTGDIFLLFMGLYCVVFFSTSVKLLQYWYSGEKDISKLRTQQLEAELKLREVELQQLKGQIHPHFLFNTLNNLYGLALEKSEQVPDAILHLSRLLDALLYRSQEKSVPLQTELKLIEDYIALEKLRVEDRFDLNWQMKGHMEACCISPFILFPFVENAFKHGFAEDTEALRLEVKGVVHDNHLQFTIINSVDYSGRTNAKQQGGIGLQNVKRRLELLYPHQHQLEIRQEQDKFIVELTLPLISHKTQAYAKN